MKEFNVLLIPIDQKDLHGLKRWISDFDNYDKMNKCPFESLCEERCYKIFNVYVRRNGYRSFIGRCPCYIFGVAEVSRIANLLLQYNIQTEMGPNEKIIKENCPDHCLIFRNMTYIEMRNLEIDDSL